MSAKFHSMLLDLADEVAAAIVKHKQGEKAPLSVSVLVTVQEELKNMYSFMDPLVFKPGYARFVLDWPDDTGLVGRLVEVDYIYKKLKRPRGG